MCGICTLPTTHANTFSAISMASLFLMVFWTFVWAWWVITKMRVENYFVNSFHAVLQAREVGYTKALRQLFITNKKWQVGLCLMLISGLLLIWAAVQDRSEFTEVEPIYTDQYMSVPLVEPVGTDVLQVDEL